jgi:hypothetical protein
METNAINNQEPTSEEKPMLADDSFYLDLADERYWLIKSRDGKTYTAGYDKQKAVDLINRLNEAHRPSVRQGEMHEVFVCWNDHDKGEKCDYVKEIFPAEALHPDVQRFIVWLYTKDEWYYDSKQSLWVQYGYRSRTTNELYQYYISKGK